MKCNDGKSNPSEIFRERLSLAESSLKGRLDEVHP